MNLHYLSFIKSSSFTLAVLGKWLWSTTRIIFQHFYHTYFVIIKKNFSISWELTWYWNHQGSLDDSSQTGMIANEFDVGQSAKASTLSQVGWWSTVDPRIFPRFFLCYDVKKQIWLKLHVHWSFFFGRSKSISESLRQVAF